ncbi:MAG TPA: hypothetical protein VKU62_14065, partial [Thermoanaerobaculia bacterium]|nr:hypothetical protein [Thermoanaerobaculia bacterium]
AGQIKETPQDVVPPSMPQNRGRNQRRPTQQQGTIIPLQQNNPAEQIWDREREPQWQARAADIELIINSLDTLERQFPELAGKMDHSKIGVAGHGYGAFIALLLGGVHAGNLALADSRVKAIVAFSPPGVAENRELTAQSFGDLHVPTLFMTGSNDRGANESENAAWRQQSFTNSPNGDKYFVLIDGARYSSFSGQVGVFAMDTSTAPMMGTDSYGRPIPVQQPQQPRGGVVFANSRSISGTIRITSLAFLDAYLKNDTSARDLLQPVKYDASFAAAHMSTK